MVTLRPFRQMKARSTTMKTTFLLFPLCLIAHVVVSDQACHPNDLMCSEASKACNDQKYQYLTPAEDFALKALIFYNHVSDGSKRRDESGANVLHSAKFYNRQAGNTKDSITFDPKFDSMESADLSQCSPRASRNMLINPSWSIV